MSLTGLVNRVRRTAVRRALRVAPWLKRPIEQTRRHYSPFELEQFAVSGGTLNPWLAKLIDPRSAKALFEGRYVYPVFSEHLGYQPPDASVVFVAVCNDKYAPGLEGLILSLLDIYPELSNRFVVYHDGSLSYLSQVRLRDIYPRFEFIHQSTDKYRVTMGNYDNHKRVGVLGYLSLEALSIENASHVVILDSDLLILGDISPLWTGDKIKAVPDIGFRPFGIVSGVTGKPIINSGVLSFPASELGPAAVARAEAVLAHIGENVDPDIARFADQKFWNIYLAQRDIELLPQNFNTIKTLVSSEYAREIGNVQILHVTGPKPWYSFTNEHLMNEKDRNSFEIGRKEFRDTFVLWNQRYLSALTRARVKAFRAQCGSNLDALKGTRKGKPAVLIGNGPSIKQTDLLQFEHFEKFVFNWFVRHEAFDEVKPDHLILPSHMFYGGWHTPNPKVPTEFLEVLAARRHKPRIWTSFYFKPLIEQTPELRDYQVDYFLFEKPLKRRIAATGVAGLDIYAPLVDSNTGVLTVGVPLALHLGIDEIVLTGCDSNYQSQAGSYFYRADEHKSASTKESSLINTWSEGGEGLYGYSVVSKALAARGVKLRDSTLNGRLTMLPRISLAEIAELGKR